MTEELRDALQRAAGTGEPAVGDAFARFTAVKRRAAIARSAVVTVVGLTAAAILVFTLPGLNSGDTGGNLIGGDGSPPPQVRTLKHYEDRVAGFQFDYPADWEIEAREGVSARLHVMGSSPDRSRLAPVPGCNACPAYRHIDVQAPYLEILVDNMSLEGYLLTHVWIGPEPEDAPRRAVGEEDVQGFLFRYGAVPDTTDAELDVDPSGEGPPFDWFAGATATVYPLDHIVEDSLIRIVVPDGRMLDEAGVAIVARSLARL